MCVIQPHIQTEAPRYIGGPASDYRISLEHFDAFTPGPAHFHDCYEIYIHLSGGKQMRCGTQILQMLPRSVYVFAPYQIHGIISEEPLRDYHRLIIYLNPALLDRLSFPDEPLQQLLDQLSQSSPNSLCVPAQQLERMSAMLPHIAVDASQLSPTSRLYARGALFILLGAIRESISLLPFSHQPPPSSDAYCQEICQYIVAHFAENITLESLAERFSISKYHLSHRFQSAYGISPYQYILSCRVDYAQQLILQDEPLQSVAIHCGFNDYSNFLRAFTRRTGHSPTRWKELHMPPDAAE